MPHVVPTPVIFMSKQELVHIKPNAFTRNCMTAQPKVLQDGGSRVRIITHKTAQRLPVKLDRAKIKTEMLEERLRAIEGRGNF